MARRKHIKYKFEDKPCVRGCGAIVQTCAPDPAPSDYKVLPWAGVCPNCYTDEERRKMNGNRTASWMS